MTARRRTYLCIDSNIQVLAKNEVKLHNKEVCLRSAQYMTHLIIVVVVGAGCAGASYQQWPPQRAAQQANMQTHRAPYTSPLKNALD